VDWGHRMSTTEVATSTSSGLRRVRSLYIPERS
jgi:hypothetical protein